MEIKLEEKSLMQACKYSKELSSAVVEGCASPDTMIFLLKNKLIDAGIMNHNLKRVISLLIWKLHVERASSNIKGELGKVFQTTIDSLQDLVNSTTEKHLAWKKKMESLEYDFENLHDSIRKKLSFTGGNFSFAVKPRIRKPICKIFFFLPFSSTR